MQSRQRWFIKCVLQVATSLNKEASSGCRQTGYCVIKPAAQVRTMTLSIPYPESYTLSMALTILTPPSQHTSFVLTAQYSPHYTYSEGLHKTNRPPQIQGYSSSREEMTGYDLPIGSIEMTEITTDYNLKVFFSIEEIVNYRICSEQTWKQSCQVLILKQWVVRTPGLTHQLRSNEHIYRKVLLN